MVLNYSKYGVTGGNIKTMLVSKSMTNALGAGEHFTSAFSAPLNGILYIHKGMYNRTLYVYKESEVVKKVTE